MSDILVFAFKAKEVRCLLNEQGEPVFVARDVAEALGLAWRGHETLASLDDDWKLVRKLRTSFGEKDAVCISEAGVYALAFRSNKPEAKAFTKWVAGEVLPSIRKTGQYVT